MEAVAGLSLAANIFQVVDFAGKILNTGQQVYQAGSTVENAELEVIVKDFEVLIRRLQSCARPDPHVLGPLPDDDQRLETLALESEKIARELIDILAKLHVNHDASRYKSYIQAIRTAWNSKKVAETKQRLDEIQKALQFRIQISTREDVLESVDDATRQILLTIQQGQDEILTQWQESEVLALKRHERLVGIISPDTLNKSVQPTDILHRIMGSLQFQRQNYRSEDITAAHMRTFGWALQAENLDTPDWPLPPSWPNLYNWLRDGQGIYWISGKAGSGKSTLMKYVYGDPRYIQALRIWAGDARLLVVNFYFWNSGSDLQKSQEGLFRSLLYQVLEQEPSLGRVLFPDQFKPRAEWDEFPTFRDSCRAFKRLTTLNNDFIKVAMLIDGLDEFQSLTVTMTELANIFLKAASSPNVKALLSSRPLAPFEFSFQQQPKLRLHQLTGNDISAYVDDKLARHARIAQLSIDDAKGVWDLVTEIVESASGVFLWVSLVVRSLLEGLQNYEKLSHLRIRLRALPRDLEDLFAHMLRNIPAEYKVESSQIFQVVWSSIGSICTLALHFAGADDDAVLGAGVSAFTRTYQDEISGRLKSCCAGLLEVSAHGTAVEYLHKSVADFLSQRAVRATIELQTAGTRFDPYLALLRSCILLIKTPKSLIASNVDETWRTLSNAMYYARGAELSTGLASPALLDGLNRAMVTRYQLFCEQMKPDAITFSADNPFSNWCDQFPYYIQSKQDEPWHDNFLAFAIYGGLTLYVNNKISSLGRKGIEKPGRPLLDLACHPGKGRTAKPLDPDLDVIETLLKCGADPNQNWGQQSSIWDSAMQLYQIHDPGIWLQVLRLLVEYGLDPNSYVDIGGQDSTGRKQVMRQSALRSVSLISECYINYPWTVRGNDRESLEANGRLEVFRMRLQPANRASQPVSVFKPAADELIQLLISKGARDEEWVQTERGSFKQTYPRSDWNPFKRTARRKG